MPVDALARRGLPHVDRAAVGRLAALRAVALAPVIAPVIVAVIGERGAGQSRQSQGREAG